MEIDEHIGCAMSGLIADARTLVEHARVETQVLFRLSSMVQLFYNEVFIDLETYSFRITGFHMGNL